MKYYIFYNENGDIINEPIMEEEGMNLSRIIYSELPKYAPRDGFYAELRVKEDTLYWEYNPIDPNATISDGELVQMFEEVM